MTRINIPHIQCDACGATEPLRKHVHTAYSNNTTYTSPPNWTAVNDGQTDIDWCPSCIAKARAAVASPNQNPA